MGRRTYRPEQIINKLREVEVFISQGATAAAASRLKEQEETEKETKIDCAINLPFS